ncbi:hypothetical protein [Antrihabitans spumae]|uniref:Uncharacterized protein n=1 Tax=Antrihabitans spumae TaxID=3373370 RepID=A0ABW7K909_9NOCA
MARTEARELFSNGNDVRVSVFDDGRLKVWSVAHAWEIDPPDRHNALGQQVRLRPARRLSAPGGTERATVICTDSSHGESAAGTVAMSNGSFFTFLHDGSVLVGNDTRDIHETFNGVRGETGGSVMITFSGTMRPKMFREYDHFVEVSEKSRPMPNRLYPGEVEILEGKIKYV